MSINRKIKRNQENNKKQDEFAKSLEASTIIGRLKGLLGVIKDVSDTIKKLTSLTKVDADIELLEGYTESLTSLIKDVETVLERFKTVGIYEVAKILKDDIEKTQELVQISLEVDCIEIIVKRIQMNIFEKFAPNITVKEKETLQMLDTVMDTAETLLEQGV